MIKYIKYAIFIFAAGVLFTLGSTFAMMHLFPLLGGGIDIHSETISDIEQEIGKPCSEVYSEAMGFVRNDVQGIIDVGLSGGDWVAVITEQQKAFIDRVYESVTKCQLLELSASETGYDLPNFSKLADIFLLLEMYTTNFDGEPASSRGMSKTAFERLVEARDALIRK